MAQQKAPSSTGGDYRDQDNDPLDDLRTASVFASLSRLYLSETYSDMKIVCGDETFHAHRAIVCPQSPFFDKALSGGFQEATSGVVVLQDDDPDILLLFLQFLYTGNYDDGLTPCADRPTVPALMEPDEVSNQLEKDPGLFVVEERRAPKAEEESKAEPVAGPAEDGVSLDEGSEFEEPGTDNEPDEEYNHFDGDILSGRLSEPTKSEQGSNDGNVPTDDSKGYFSKSRGLLTHTRVYIMAHIYDVPSLRLLARDRFYRAAENCYSTNDAFAEAVDEVYSRTPETDVAMREIMCRITAQGILYATGFKAKIEPTMRKHGDFAVGVLNYVLALDLGEWN